MVDASKIELRMRRLLALVRRGEDGERENAERALSRLLEKHGYTLDDIDCDEMNLYKFAVKSDEEMKLLVQVICKVTDSSAAKMRGRRNIQAAMTTGEHVEVSALFEVYRDEWRKEASRTLSAFFVRNRIWPESMDEFDVPKKVLSAEDLKEEARVARRAGIMDRVRTEKMIEGECANG